MIAAKRQTLMFMILLVLVGGAKAQLHLGTARYRQPAAFSAMSDAPNQVSVRAFGAGGGLDDSAAINSAIATINAKGGGIVYFPPGTYLAQGLAIYPNVYYVGGGANATTVKLKSGATDHLFKAAASASDFTIGGFRDITLDGQGTSSYDGITFQAVQGNLNRFAIRNCIVRNFRRGYAGPLNTSGSISAANYNGGTNKTTITSTAHGLLTNGGAGQSGNVYLANGPLLGQGSGSVGTVLNSGSSLAVTVVDADTFTVSGDFHTATNWYLLTGEYGSYFCNVEFSGNDIGLLTYENPFITGCQFNGNSIAHISGRLFDAFVSANYFEGSATYSIAPDGADGGVSLGAYTKSCGVTDSTITGNMFYGGGASGVHLYLEDDNTVSGNKFVGLSGAMTNAIVIRGVRNQITANGFGRPGTNGDFSGGAITWSQTSSAGNNLATIGRGTNVSGNSFYCSAGPGIKQEPAGTPNLAKTGIAVTGNTFEIAADATGNACAIDFSNANAGGGANYTRDCNFSGNNFTVAVNITKPLLYLRWSFYGNRICENTVDISGGATSKSIFRIDASGTQFNHNRIFGATAAASNETPFNFAPVTLGTLVTDANTRARGNIALNGSGTEVANGLEQRGTVNITSGNTTASVTFSPALVAAPSAQAIKVWFTTSPGSAKQCWASNVTASGFTMNVDANPGATVTIGWEAVVY